MRAIQFLGSLSPQSLASSLALATILGLLPVAMSVASANVAGLLPTELLATGARRNQVQAAVVAWAVVFIGAFVLLAIVNSLAEAFNRYVSRLADGAAKAQVMKLSLTPDGVEHLEGAASATIKLAKTAVVTGRTPGSAVESILPVLAPRIRVLGYLGAVIAVSPVLGAVMTVLTLVNQPSMCNSLLRIMTGTRLFVSDTGAGYFRELALTSAGAKEVRVFGLSSWLQSRHRQAVREAMGSMERRPSGEFNTYLLVLLLVNAMVIAAGTGWLVFQTTAGSLGTVSLVLGMVSLVALAPQFVLNDAFLIAGSVSLERLEAATKAVAQIARSQPPSHAEHIGALTSIDFEDVSFAYQAADHLVLDHLNLRLRAGEITALVGLNGAGKTTLVKLLARLYAPTEGRIAMDGVDLRDIDIRTWRRELSILFQDFIKYELPAEENVSLGSSSRRPLAEDELRRVLELARADEFLERLPKGLSTPLSGRLKGGVDVSGGQWQRVALARALGAVLGGSRLLVLDEPTANLDVRVEAELFDELAAVLKSGALAAAPILTLLISHRFSTVRRAQRIVVLSGGRVEEDGTHDELIANGGLYAELFAVQSSQFMGVGEATE